MGHKLNTILRALRVLQEAAIRGEVPRPSCGVCGNLDSLIGHQTDAYEFVREYADDWTHAMRWGDGEGVGYRAGTLKDYFVPDVEGVGQWQGPNLDLRLDLIKFLIKKCKAVLASTKAEAMQSVYQLSKVLADTIDKFEGISETARNYSMPLFTMLERSFQGKPVDQWDVTPCVQNLHCLADMLTESGFYLLGYGYFSMVLGHDDQPDTAFKISLKPEDSYVAYAMYCRQNPGPHLPKILCMIRAQEGQIIAIKRYSTFSEGLRYMPRGRGYAFPNESYSFMCFWREAETTRRDRAYAISRNPIYTESYIQTLIAIGKHFEGAASFDLHDANLMFDRDTCTFIITDPVSFKKENVPCY